MAFSRTLPARLLLPLFALPLAGCIETQLTVELFTQIHPDGTCTRRVEYRLERVDPEKGNLRVALRPEDDILRFHRFPSGDPWVLQEETETGLRVVVVEGVLPAPAHVDGDYFRARSPRDPPARNYVSAFLDTEHGVYEYQEVLRDPASPLAAARALSRAALKRDEAFAESFRLALGDEAGPSEADVRRAYRELLAEPFAREVKALAERPYYGPRAERARPGLHAPRREAEGTRRTAQATCPGAASRGGRRGRRGRFQQYGRSPARPSSTPRACR